MGAGSRHTIDWLAPLAGVGARPRPSRSTAPLRSATMGSTGSAPPKPHLRLLRVSAGILAERDGRAATRLVGGEKVTPGGPDNVDHRR
ncbi:MAG: hypothetical protein ACRD0D_07090 [Acidimicrobiales bacterium]